MSDERDRFLENEDEEVEETEVEAHKFAANDEGDDEPDVEAHKHAGVNRPANP